MALHWPWALLALLAFPSLLAFRWWTRRRRRREAVRLPSLTLVRAALPGRSLWRRRIPLWLFAAGLVILGTGAARPQAVVPVPTNNAAILLAMDVSGSMCSTDVEPNRLTAAQDAARDFIKAQPKGTKVGLVTFAGIAGLLVQPTADKKKLLDAIDTLRTGRGTAIGMGIMTALDAIAEINPDVPPTGVQLSSGDPNGGTADKAEQLQPDTIIVLTDGRNTHGVEPLTAASEAAARGVRVYTIGFGTAQPSPLVCTPEQISGDSGFRPERQGPPGGFARYQLIDEETLSKVADLTGGEYFKAEDAKQLSRVLLDLPSSIVLTKKNIELTFWFALAGALLILIAVGLSQWWNRTQLPTLTGGQALR